MGCLYVQEEGSELGRVIGNPDTQEAHLPTTLGSLGVRKEREGFQGPLEPGSSVFYGRPMGEELWGRRRSGVEGAALTLMPSQEKSVRVCCKEKRRGGGYPGTSSEGLPEVCEVGRAFLRVTPGTWGLSMEHWACI